MEIHAGIKTFYAKNRKAWRTWLEKNGVKEKSVWLIIYRKDTSKKTVNYVEAVEDALCYGWIDSKANKRDAKSFDQSFAKRNPKSNWSKINKERVAMLIENGLMTLKGIEAIELAKKNGAWTALDKIENLEIPADLKKALKQNAEAARHFNAFPRSVKKGILGWIQDAKREETREKRIKETVLLAQKNTRANQYTHKS
ncbi:MAG TPA: YdeI/OmpD-associated family protein [Chitinophagaceae bacterium]|nr:YdeI/OmpD-associated family protein [Chitinophagaceae bacterium]